MDEIRSFETGATRSKLDGKHQYEGFLSPIVIERFGQYMSKHRVQPDGKLREADNWQKGIPRDTYIDSAFRHFVEWWKAHRGYPNDGLEDALCALMFNVMGYLHEELKTSVMKRKENTIINWSVLQDNRPGTPKRTGVLL